MLFSCSISLDHQTQCVCLRHRPVWHRDRREGLQFAVMHYGLALHSGHIFASSEVLSSPQRKVTVYRGLHSHCRWEALDGTSVHEFVWCYTTRETTCHKTEYGHKAKSHLNPTLPGHQMRNTGTPKVFWKSAILNCCEMLFHDVRLIEHAMEI